MSYTEHVVHDFEALVAGGVVHSSDVRYLRELGCGVVLEEREDGDDAARGNVDGELVLPDAELLYVFWQAGNQILPVLVQSFRLVGDLVGWVDDRGVQDAMGTTLGILQLVSKAFVAGERRYLLLGLGGRQKLGRF